MDEKLFKERLDKLRDLQAKYKAAKERVDCYTELLKKCSAGVTAVSSDGMIAYLGGVEGKEASCSIPTEDGGIHSFRFVEKDSDGNCLYRIEYGKKGGDGNYPAADVKLKRGDKGLPGDPGVEADTYFGKTYYDNDRVKCNVKPVSVFSGSATGLSVSLSGVSAGVKVMSLSVSAAEVSLDGAFTSFSGMKTDFSTENANVGGADDEMDGGDEEDLLEDGQESVDESVIATLDSEEDVTDSEISGLDISLPGGSVDNGAAALRNEGFG